MKHKAVIIISIIVGMLSFAGVVSITFLHPDGLFGCVLGLPLASPTFYAPTYTFRGYYSIKPGMTEEQVIRLVGEPLGKYNNPGPNGTIVCWRYTDDRLGENYKIRDVLFKDGKVFKKYSMLYLD